MLIKRKCVLKVFNAVELLEFAQTDQIPFALHPCDPFLINNRNMTGNSVKKYCFAVLNVKLPIKIRLKTLY